MSKRKPKAAKAAVASRVPNTIQTIACITTTTADSLRPAEYEPVTSIGRHVSRFQKEADAIDIRMLSEAPGDWREVPKRYSGIDGGVAIQGLAGKGLVTIRNTIDIQFVG